MMTLTRNVKKETEKAGFVAVGISNLDMLHKLPYGKIKHVGTLKNPGRGFARSQISHIDEHSCVGPSVQHRRARAKTERSVDLPTHTHA
jgi:hypothetical protein